MLSNLLKFFEDFSKNRKTREKVIIKTFSLVFLFLEKSSKILNILFNIFYFHKLNYFCLSFFIAPAMSSS